MLLDGKKKTNSEYKQSFCRSKSLAKENRLFVQRTMAFLKIEELEQISLLFCLFYFIEPLI